MGKFAFGSTATDGNSSEISRREFKTTVGWLLYVGGGLPVQREGTRKGVTTGVEGAGFTRQIITSDWLLEAVPRALEL